MRITNDDNSRKRHLRRTFRNPPRGKVRRGSLLVLLRSDLQLLYGPEAAASHAVKTPLLTALGIFAGIELLAKYWSGKADTGPSDVRKFLIDIVNVSGPDAEVLLQFRNSLAHGYGLKTRRRKDGRPFAFSLDTEPPSGSCVVQPDGADAYVVNLWLLKRLFLSAIRGCRQGLLRDSMRLGYFEVCTKNLAEVAVTA